MRSKSFLPIICLHRSVSGRRIGVNVTSGSLNINSSVTLPAGGTEPYTVKPGPLIARVFPAAAANFPLELAPRMLIAIYGSDLAIRHATSGSLA